MRKFINLIEHITDDEQFIFAIREWGDNTLLDRSRKEQALRALGSRLAPYRIKHKWLYRGHVTSDEDIVDLRNGLPVMLEFSGALSSWSADPDQAANFLRFAGASGVLVAKKGLKTFFDFNSFGAHLRDIGYAVDPEDYPLSDPIREEEVIVETGPIKITMKDVMFWQGIDENGDDISGHNRL